MAKEWGVSYVSHFGGLETQEIWVTCDSRAGADEYVRHLEKHVERGAISGLQLHVRHVTEWQPEEGQS